MDSPKLIVMDKRRAKVGAVLNRLGSCVCITVTSLVELGIPSKAIRDSEPSSDRLWVDARRLRRHMRKYHSYKERSIRRWLNSLPKHGSVRSGRISGR